MKNKTWETDEYNEGNCTVIFLSSSYVSHYLSQIAPVRFFPCIKLHVYIIHSFDPCGSNVEIEDTKVAFLNISTLLHLYISISNALHLLLLVAK